MTTSSQAKSHNDNTKAKSSISGWDLRKRASSGLSTVRKEATAPRLAAAAGVGAFAAAAAFLSSATRRESIAKSAHGLADRWHGGSRDAIKAGDVGTAPAA